jgi:hypothetical protein
MSSRDFDLSGFEVQGSTGLDAFFSREPEIVSPTPTRVKVASIRDLSPFIRLSNDELIHKSERDLWSIRREPSGGMYVERMFDDNGSPLKV